MAQLCPNVGGCEYLRDPSHGHVSVTTLDVEGRATYTCNSEFRLIGLSNRTCLSDGTWSGSEPICNCVLHQISSFSVFILQYFFCLTTDTLSVLCPDLDHPGNGSVSVSFTHVGERARYRCNYGYRLSGNSSRTCQLSGEWTGTQPTCISECIESTKVTNNY